MEKINKLQALLNFVLLASMVIFVFLITGTIAALFSGNLSKINFTMHGMKIKSVDTFLVFVMLVTVLGYAFFMMALAQLKKLLGLFVNKQFFTTGVIKGLKKIGIYLLASIPLMYLPAYVYESYTSGNTEIKLSSVGPDSFIFLIIIALFFLTLSYIFEQAQQIQEESELTI